MIPSRRLIPLLLLVVLPQDALGRQPWSLPANIGRTARWAARPSVTSIGHNAPTKTSKKFTALGLAGGETTISGGITSGDQSTEKERQPMAESPVEEQAIDVPAIEARETELEASASAARSVSGGASTTASITDTPVSSSPNSLNTTITLDEHEAATAKTVEVHTENADEEKKRKGLKKLLPKKKDKYHKKLAKKLRVRTFFK